VVWISGSIRGRVVRCPERGFTRDDSPHPEAWSESDIQKNEQEYGPDIERDGRIKTESELLWYEN